MSKKNDAHDYSKDIIREDERVDQTGEIYTPSWMVNKMLDDIPKEYWSDPTKTFLEPSAGDGNFVYAIYNRLFEGLKDVIPNEEERHKHIIEKQIYAVEIMEDNFNKILERLNVGNLKHNIIRGNTLKQYFGEHKQNPFEINESEQILIKAEEAKEKKKVVYKQKLNDMFKF